ncbi:FAD/NAD(P)-binding protein [Variovorax sp. DT-64]|uniref:FAD/NAD(P)-binding protein n=1 Tax=Variovorax sp. DT-64 TaxID=3396160 RepID=UPI003F19AE28
MVGGGVSAASFAVQLVRSSRERVDITIIEPREHAGRGLAYSATDPDYRLNAPLDIHWIDPQRPLELRQWCEATGVLQRDGGSLTANGQVFLRRSDLGEYLSAQIQAHANNARTGSSIRHVRDTAKSVQRIDGLYRVSTNTHGDIAGEMLVIATGNPVPSLRPPFRPEHRSDARIIANPLEPNCLDRIPPASRVLVVGSGLTALDIISTLVRRDHGGGILVVSRRGLRPRPQSPETLHTTPKPPELSSEVPGFISAAPARVSAWSAALREEIARKASQGQNWYQVFDPVRDVVWKLWPKLPTREKERFLRRLRVFYDVHRFRTPPMNEALVADAERKGRVRYSTATLRTVESGADAVRVELSNGAAPVAGWHDFDFVVNCTGLDSGSAWRSNPLLHNLLESGLLRLHPTGIGFDVSEQCEALDATGAASPTLRVIGPPTAGAFGDPVAIPFIANQVRRMLPHLLGTLQSISLRDQTHEQYSTD